MAVYVLEKQHVNILNATYSFLITHTCWQLCSVSLPWYTLDWLDWSVYFGQVHARAGRIWRVHDDKELQELSVSPFYRFPSLITVISSLFLCLLVKRKIKSTRFTPLNWTMYHCVLLRNEVCTDCMAMDILPECCRVHDHWSHLIYNTVLTTVIKEIVKVISIIVYQI